MMDISSKGRTGASDPASAWLSRDLSVEELGRAYAALAGEWLLLEVIEGEPGARDAKYRLIGHGTDRERLHQVIGEDEDWNWDRRCLLILADPEKPCKWCNP